MDTPFLSTSDTHFSSFICFSYYLSFPIYLPTLFRYLIQWSDLRDCFQKCYSWHIFSWCHITHCQCSCWVHSWIKPSELSMCLHIAHWFSLCKTSIALSLSVSFLILFLISSLLSWYVYHSPPYPSICYSYLTLSHFSTHFPTTLPPSCSLLLHICLLDCHSWHHLHALHLHPHIARSALSSVCLSANFCPN